MSNHLTLFLSQQAASACTSKGSADNLGTAACQSKQFNTQSSGKSPPTKNIRRAQIRCSDIQQSAHLSQGISKNLRCLCRRFLCSGSVLALALTGLQSQASTVFINEIHYDNDGIDVDEGIEIVAQAGTSLEDWQLLFYNGNNGSVYKTNALTGSFSDQSNGYGFMHVVTGGLQNGPSDGVALINSLGQVIEFLSYEGDVTATDGAALGLTSTDIGISESINAALGISLQRTGTGSEREDFSWTAANATFGGLNAGQNLMPHVSSIPLPASIIFFASSLTGLAVASQRHRSRARQT